MMLGTSFMTLYIVSTFAQNGVPSSKAVSASSSKVKSNVSDKENTMKMKQPDAGECKK